MTSFTHLLVGGAIGTLVGSSLGNGGGGMLGVPLVPLGGAALGGLLSHFLFDSIPHNDYLYYFKNNWRLIYLSPLSWAFLVGGGLAVLLLSWGHPQMLPIWTGAFFGLLPDLMTGLTRIFNFGPTRFDFFHWQVHGRRDLGERWYRQFSQDLPAGRQGPLTGKDENGQRWDDFARIKNSFWGKVGWGVELGVEVLVVGVAIYFLRSGSLG